MSVYARLGGMFSAWIATGHPRFPRAGLAARYADHPNGTYRQLAVRDPAAGPHLIERLSHDPDVRTRQAAGDPRLPLPRLVEALALPELASSAGANPALPPGEMAGSWTRPGYPHDDDESDGPASSTAAAPVDAGGIRAVLPVDEHPRRTHTAAPAPSPVREPAPPGPPARG
ncbi:hypothetical protein OG342_38590 [Streptomyces bobili]|uniref:hypothetical protein n=1 Tax=Streptomyces bobili TaxID=67280 RepID=UPI002257E763|nr:hypothetical protein [Streptomyces bobili]MCX5528694.1 hypothetical protein [Streptomyces bobili]